MFPYFCMFRYFLVVLYRSILHTFSGSVTLKKKKRKIGKDIGKMPSINLSFLSHHRGKMIKHKSLLYTSFQNVEKLVVFQVQVRFRFLPCKIISFYEENIVFFSIRSRFHEFQENFLKSASFIKLRLTLRTRIKVKIDLKKLSFTSTQCSS